MKTLYVKFIVVTIGIIMVSFFLAFILSNAYYQQKLKPLNDEKNTAVALEVVAFLEEHPDVPLSDYLSSISAVGYQMALVNQQWERTYYGDSFRDKFIPESTIRSVLDGNVFHGISLYPQQTFVTGFFADELRNTIGVPLTYHGERYALLIRPNIKFLFTEMHMLFGWIFLLTILLTIGMVIIYTRYLIKPISSLTKATKALASGDFHVELDSRRQDELGVLSQNFLQMARKLARMDEMRKEFISNISHDIQSPLSNIKGYANLLENEAVSQEKREHYIQIINSEIQRLSTLTKQLLLLAALDRIDHVLDQRCLNVGQQMKELLQSYQWVIREKELMLSYSLPDIELVGDPALLNTLWDNLITNAIKYNKPHGSITVSLEKMDDWLNVMIEDTGIGMTQSDLDRMFDRFYRADQARTRTIEGTGLGLSIVKTIVDLHGGTVRVTSELEKGTIFVVELPVGGP